MPLRELTEQCLVHGEQHTGERGKSVPFSFWIEFMWLITYFRGQGIKFRHRTRSDGLLLVIFHGSLYFVILRC